MFTWKGYLRCKDDLKQGAEYYICKPTHIFKYAWTTSRRLYTWGGGADFSSYSVLFHIALFSFIIITNYFHLFPFQNKQKHPLHHTGRESEVKEC